jgi:phosphoglycolate phosphatase-like HAD superfamily hydrolase
MGDLLVLWDVDGTLLNAGDVGGDLYETVFSSMFGQPCEKLAPMAGRTDRAIILDTLEMAGIPDPRRHVDPFIEGLRSEAPHVYEAVQQRGRALPGATEAMAALASATVGKSTIGFAVPGTALPAPDAATAPASGPAPTGPAPTRPAPTRPAPSRSGDGGTGTDGAGNGGIAVSVIRSPGRPATPAVAASAFIAASAAPYPAPAATAPAADRPAAIADVASPAAAAPSPLTPAPGPLTPAASAPAAPSPLAPAAAAPSPLAPAASAPSPLTPAASAPSPLTPVASAAAAPASDVVPSGTVAPAPFAPDAGTAPIGTGPAPAFPVVTPAPLDPRPASGTTAITSAAPASDSAATAARPPSPGARKRPPAARVYQSVLTGNVRPLAEVKLAAVGLRCPLDLCIGAYGDDHEDRTQLIHLARRRAVAVYGSSSSDFSGTATIVVGDTPEDIEAALAAGARAVGVATGGYSAKALQEAGAHAVLTDLTNTAAVLTALLS